MIKSKPRAPLTDIDVGPFSDISFLLIIFFILTTQIAAFKGTVVNIPSGSKTQDEKKKDELKQLTIELKGTSIMLIDTNAKGVPVDLVELKDRLMVEDLPNKANVNDRFVVLQADKAVPYELYFKVVVMIQECGGYISLLEDDSPQQGGN